jgi:hypothetical protein
VWLTATDQRRHGRDTGQELSGHTFFFYGSLMDRELLEVVLDRTTPDLTFTPGWLAGYVAETARGYTFPTLVERRGGRVHGIVTQGLTEDDVERIGYFEDTTEYAPIVADISTAETEIAVRLYIATTALPSTGEPWSFERWLKRDKALLLAVTLRVMREHYGITPIAEADAHWHRIKAEIEAEMHAPVQLKPKRLARRDAPTRGAPRRATRATSPKRHPRG